MASSQDAQAEPFCIFCGQLLDKESSIGFGCCSRHGLHVKCSLHMCGLPAAASHYIWTGDCSFFDHINDKNYYCCTSSGWNRLRIHTLCQDLLHNDKEGTWWYIFKGASGFSCDCPLCLLKWANSRISKLKKSGHTRLQQIPPNLWLQVDEEGNLIYREGQSDQSMMQGFSAYFDAFSDISNCEEDEQC